MGKDLGFDFSSIRSLPAQQIFTEMKLWRGAHNGMHAMTLHPDLAHRLVTIGMLKAVRVLEIPIQHITSASVCRRSYFRGNDAEEIGEPESNTDEALSDGDDVSDGVLKTKLTSTYTIGTSTTYSLTYDVVCEVAQSSNGQSDIISIGFNGRTVCRCRAASYDYNNDGLGDFTLRDIDINFSKRSATGHQIQNLFMALRTLSEPMIQCADASPMAIGYARRLKPLIEFFRNRIAAGHALQKLQDLDIDVDSTRSFATSSGDMGDTSDNAADE